MKSQVFKDGTVVFAALILVLIVADYLNRSAEPTIPNLDQHLVATATTANVTPTALGATEPIPTYEGSDPQNPVQLEGLLQKTAEGWVLINGHFVDLIGGEEVEQFANSVADADGHHVIVRGRWFADTLVATCIAQDRRYNIQSVEVGNDCDLIEQPR